MFNLFIDFQCTHLGDAKRLVFTKTIQEVVLLIVVNSVFESSFTSPRE